MPYILPAVPPLAIVIADRLATLTERGGSFDSRRLAAIGPLLGIGGFVAIGVAIYAADFRAPYPMLVRPALEAGGAILVAGAVGESLFCGESRPTEYGNDFAQLDGHLLSSFTLHSTGAAEIRTRIDPGAAQRWRGYQRRQ